MKHYEYEISMFLDNELDEEAQVEMFAHLAHCKECRKELADVLTLKEKTKTLFAEEIKRIKTGPITIKKTNYKTPFYAAAAAAVILLFLFINKAPEAKPVIQTQVVRDTVYIKPAPERQQIVAAVNEEKTAVKPRRKTELIMVKDSDKYYLEYIQSLPGVKLTGADRIENANGRNL